MHDRYGRNLDLNLLRVFVVVAEVGSVTGAAARLYLTQPAISAALRRLTNAVGIQLLVRNGRGVALSKAGEQMLAAVRPHLEALILAALAPPTFVPATSQNVIRIGLSDTTESWVLPALLRVLARQAPAMAVISIPVQFRTVIEALTSRRVDLALSIADDVPATIKREPAFIGSFVCLYDPRKLARIGRTISAATYFANEHVIVSYNADLRGIVEDSVATTRNVRCSLASFAHIGEVIDDSKLLATVPATVARQIRVTRPYLRTAALPFVLRGAPFEMLWPIAVDDDAACRYVREVLRGVLRQHIK